MPHRSPRPPARASRRVELTRISAEASKHVLTVGPFRGRVVGALVTAVLEDTLLFIRRELEQPHPRDRWVESLEADQRAINEERERRWLAFTS